ncbi:Uncharacterized protein dnl_33290 [Desulfonema limicola]|uniref:Uncharacterized protein n=1 Tax=Desulfonema limicola TaxID=45656 RepID=A0A975B939_9BACT|nr:hypothetical protein [Desulfonema limicola]QTA81008.1 Uncharacterized protein dnl_33290 [Desulfonema limicola]
MELDTIVFGGFTLKDILIYGGLAVVILMILSFIKKLFTSKEPEKYTQAVKCAGCGWSGRVSEFAGRCPQCNSPLGAQKASSRK